MASELSAKLKKLHVNYGKLLKIKPMISVTPRKSFINRQNIIDVHYVLVKSILNCLHAMHTDIPANDAIKCRAKVMQIALILDETIYTSTQLKCNKFARLKHALDKFQLHADKPEIVYVFFTALCEAAKLAAAEAKSNSEYDDAIDMIQRADKIFNACHTIHRNDVTALKLYDTRELFSKHHELQPMADAFARLHKMHMHNLNLLATIYQSMQLSVAYYTVWHRILSYDTNKKSLCWMRKLVHIIPEHIELRLFQSARYYMEVIGQLLKDMAQSEPQLTEYCNIHLDVANAWINYTLSLFAYSRDCGNWGTAADQVDQLEFVPFDDIPLDCNRYRWQSNIIQSHAQAHELYTICLSTVECLLKTCDVQRAPMEYIALNYQLFDLYTKMAQFSKRSEDHSNYIRMRMDMFNGMLCNVRENSPHTYGVLEKTFLLDFNEMQVELLTTNLQRALDLTADDDDIGDVATKDKRVKVLDALQTIRLFNQQLSAVSVCKKQ